MKNYPPEEQQAVEASIRKMLNGGLDWDALHGSVCHMVMEATLLGEALIVWRKLAGVDADAAVRLLLVFSLASYAKYGHDQQNDELDQRLRELAAKYSRN